MKTKKPVNIVCLSYNFHTGTVTVVQASGFPSTKIIIVLLLKCYEFQKATCVAVLVTDMSETVLMIVI